MPPQRASALLTSLCIVLLLTPASASVAQQTRRAYSWTLPTPTGPYAVGTTISYLTVPAPEADSGTESARPRQLPVQLWYPAQARAGGTTVAYIPDAALLEAMKEQDYLDLSDDLLESWRTVRTHARSEAPLVRAPRELPLLLFSHGFGVSRSNYTSILEDLASHGYVVAAIDHPGLGFTTLPDGTVSTFAPLPGGPPAQVEQSRADAGHVLDALLGNVGDVERPDAWQAFPARLDRDRVGMLGHSLGGAAALDACRTDPRFRACVNLDGDPFGRVEEEGVARPYLVILHVPEESQRPPREVREQRDATWAAVAAKQPTPATVAKIENTMHLSFSDLPFLVPDELLRRNGAVIEPARGFDATMELVRAFLDRWLRGEEGVTLEAVASGYPEVTVRRLRR